MILFNILNDTIPNIPDISNADLYNLLSNLKAKDTSTTLNLTNILLALIAFLGTVVGGIWTYVKIKASNKQHLAIKNVEINKIATEADIKSDTKFQEKIVYKFFEEYVKQNTWITDQFGNQFAILLSSLDTQNKLMKDVYAQIDTFRRELRSYNLNTQNNLKKIDGILIERNKSKN